ncbi:Phosphate regulon transcriptional regulatory protein PhoB [Herminiimonas arsenicoxydans]|uniref:Phosphate regulon transcriptional regulatory protein PhoB n=1 Tax=Herminiimonas arsenicoxydans TaxID=204773 RepID=A4G2G5_HERAR|nr:Phosphate regulon transcriptional regulatory protein PhoB [Herminiimonas arsenicoxydans]
MSGDKATILVVEDELSIVELLRFTLEDANWNVVAAGSVAAAWDLIQIRPPHLILLDWMLPDQSGLQLLSRVRESRQFRGLPIIMLTAKSMEEDKVTGLENGADDYVTKPFSPRELIARVTVLLKHKVPEHAQETMKAGPIRLDPASRMVSVGTKNITIGHAEFKLLKYLLAHPNHVYSRDQLIDRVWGRHIAIDERTVDVNVLRLRKVLGEGRYLIKTVRGVGYMLTEK